MDRMPTHHPTILVFDDDEEVRNLWEMMLTTLKIEGAHIFGSWEEFVANGNPALARDAIAFVDNNFEKTGSLISGVEIARRLRGLAVGKIYSISADPSGIERFKHLFDAILGTKMPKNMLALCRPPQAAATAP